MGNWRIEIEGHGVHHNGRADDADHLTKDLVKALKESGHELTLATFILTQPTSSTAVGPPENLLKES